MSKLEGAMPPRRRLRLTLSGGNPSHNLHKVPVYKPNVGRVHEPRQVQLKIDKTSVPTVSACTTEQSRITNHR